MLHEPDVRALIRLLGEVSILSGDSTQKKRVLLNGLSDLIHGDIWTWSLNRFPENHSESVFLDGMFGGDAISPLTVGPDEGVQKNHTAQVSASALKSSHERGLNFTVRQIADGTISTISMARRLGRPPFSRREIKMAQIVLSEVSWLHEPSPDPMKKPTRISLPPRQRSTLIYLMDGLGHQAIAEKLQISPHTVHGYVKDIYRRFQVNSRAALLKQFSSLPIAERLPS